MSSLLEKLQGIDPIDALDLTARALEVIDALADNATTSSAADAIMAVKHVVDVVTRTSKKKLTADEARVELTKLMVGISINDGLVSSAVDAKFDKG